MPGAQFQALLGAVGGPDGFTKLLLHCDGANNSTTFTDSSGSAHAITANASAKISTSNVEFGTGSMLLGANDTVTALDHADWNFGTGDFTIDFWANHSSISGSSAIFYINGGFGSWALYYDPNMHSITWDDATNAALTGTSMPTGSYAHLAVVRNSDNLFVFKNGTATIAQSGYAGVSINSAGGGIQIGTKFVGNLDEIRISKGIARWTTNFTPPTIPYS